MNIDIWRQSLLQKDRPDEYEVKQLLKAEGVRIPEGTRLLPDDPIRVVFPGPYAAKVCSPDVVHKTDAGGVLLNIQEDDLVGQVALIRSRFPGKPIIVEQMEKPRGVEIITGAVHDPVLGPAVMVGAGGIMTEIYRDTAFRLAPFSVGEADRMLSELTIAPALDGFRGIHIDRCGLTELLSHFSNLVADMAEYFGSIDLNPILFTDKGWVAVDAYLEWKK